MDQKDLMQQLKENVTEAHNTPGSSARAVQIEVSTTKTSDQKAEIAEELFPSTPRKKRMRTHRVMH